MLAETCVFGKQSPRAILCGPFKLRTQVLHSNGAPLLPKLRGQFAEFLNEVSLAHLRILSSPTCVGLEYGYMALSLRGFSWQCGDRNFPKPEGRVDISSQAPNPDFPGFIKALLPCPKITITPYSFPTALPHRSNLSHAVQEYKPVSHRLRLSTSS